MKDKNNRHKFDFIIELILIIYFNLLLIFGIYSVCRLFLPH